MSTSLSLLLSPPKWAAAAAARCLAARMLPVVAMHRAPQCTPNRRIRPHGLRAFSRLVQQRHYRPPGVLLAGWLPGCPASRQGACLECIGEHDALPPPGASSAVWRHTAEPLRLCCCCYQSNTDAACFAAPEAPPTLRVRCAMRCSLRVSRALPYMNTERRTKATPARNTGLGHCKPGG
jgi:hypothetical protein